MRADIEFFYKPENPVSLDSVKTQVEDKDFSLKIEDKDIIEQIWFRDVLSLNPKAFSGALATLYDTQNGLTYNRTEFKHYVAISRTSKSKELDSDLYNHMRVAAVGASLELADGSIFVHRRSPKATHCPNLLDSSCAGLCFVEWGNLNPKKALLEKLKRELGLNSEEVQIKGLVGIHSAGSPDFSSLFDIALKTNLSPQELEKRLKPGAFLEYTFVPKNKLADYIVKHYASENDMIGDGAATLMGALGREQFYYVVGKIKDSGKRVEFGRLENNVFVQKS